MRPRTYSSEGVILARKDYSEADRILVVFSDKYGKISLIAKGVRKPKSRKRGSLEVFSHIKFSAARGRNLDILTEAETIYSFKMLRRRLNKVALAYFFIETIGRTTKENEKNKDLFDLLLSYLKKLEKQPKLRSLKNAFIEDALILLGFWPKGKEMRDPDKLLTEVVEREMHSSRVGRKILT